MLFQLAFSDPVSSAWFRTQVPAWTAWGLNASESYFNDIYLHGYPWWSWPMMGVGFLFGLGITVHDTINAIEGRTRVREAVASFTILIMAAVSIHTGILITVFPDRDLQDHIRCKDSPSRYAYAACRVELRGTPIRGSIS
ncbi:hypothetical protein [Streptosporangium sp. KLBMP 9127]|nr:hypothetical protein [Streptosporangium sp. KLBMP 9127]MCG5220792.1 hypothetical protein [Streptosporangium sp. KLBMP 9127]